MLGFSPYSNPKECLTFSVTFNPHFEEKNPNIFQNLNQDKKRDTYGNCGASTAAMRRKKRAKLIFVHFQTDAKIYEIFREIVAMQNILPAFKKKYWEFSYHFSKP